MDRSLIEVYFVTSELSKLVGCPLRLTDRAFIKFI